VPWGTTALQGLRDAGGVRAGQKVLVIGAAGAVGTWAVQLARSMGAEVTAVCSAKNAERVRGLGATEVIDYATADYVTGGARFDVVFDLVGTRALSEVTSVVVKGGTYVAAAAGDGGSLATIRRLAAVALRGLFSSRVKVKSFMQRPCSEDLVALAAIVDAGQAKPVIGLRASLARLGEAFAVAGSGHAQGQTLLLLR
jgi:NADPH:quinone reductase-like Zn-dependent oxidoreductase